MPQADPTTASDLAPRRPEPCPVKPAWLEALREAADALLSAPDPAATPEAVAEVLLQALDADGCAVLRASPQAPSMTPLLAVGETPRATHPTIPLNSPPGRAAATREPVIVSQATEEGIANALCVPISLPDGNVGALEVVNKRAGAAFTESDTEIAAAIASHLAVALSLRRDWAAYGRELQRLQALVSVGELLHRETDPGYVLEGLLRMAQDMVGADAGFCYRFDSQGEQLSVVAAVGRGADEAAHCRLSVADSVEGSMVESASPAIVNDLPAEAPGRPSIADALDFPVRSLLCCALRLGDEAYGVVELVNSPRGAGFGPEDAQLLSALAAQAAVAAGNSVHLERLKRAFILTVECLSMAFEAPQPGWQNPPHRVVPIARRTAQALGLPAVDQEVVVLAALLHDLGKIAIEPQLLHEPRKLTDRERTVIRAHPLVAAQFLEPLTGTHLAAVADALRHHHEWVDGRGYPDGLRGEQIPIASRVLAVVHAFCAMTEGRPYQPAKGADEAIGELRRWTDSQFDAATVEGLVTAVSS